MSFDFENYAQNLIETGESLLQPIHVAQAKQHGYIITGAKEYTRAIASYSAVDLESIEVNPPPFIIDKILPAGFIVLAAPPKWGKSWMCLDICCSVASGTDFWGCKTSIGDVLYLDLEGRAWRIKDRIKIMQREITKRLNIAHEANMLDSGLITQLSSWVNNADNPRLIVIDTIGRIKSGARRGENSYESDSRMYSPLQKLATEKRLSIIAVTHLRKSSGLAMDDPFENIMGSTGLFGVADAAWMIRGRRSDKEKTFIATGRDFDPIESAIVFNRETCRWKLVGECEALAETREKATYDSSPLVITIKQMLAENKGRFEIQAADLYVEIAQRTNEYPADSPAVLGKLIRKYASFLIRYDGIYYTPPSSNGGSKGRKHVFSNKQERHLYH